MVCIYNAAPVIKITCCIDCVQLPVRYARHGTPENHLREKRSQSPISAAALVCVAVGNDTGARRGTKSRLLRNGLGTRVRRLPNQFTIESKPLLRQRCAGQSQAGSAISLTFQDAIDLGLKNNLGVLLQSYNIHRRPGTEMERVKRASSQRERWNQRNRGATKSGGGGFALSRISHDCGALRLLDARVYLASRF